MRGQVSIHRFANRRNSGKSPHLPYFYPSAELFKFRTLSIISSYRPWMGDGEGGGETGRQTDSKKKREAQTEREREREREN